MGKHDKKFNEKEADHEITMTKLSHKFALKMALMICWSLVSTVTILGILFGAVTPIALTIIVIVGFILGTISFSITRGACLL